MAYNESTGVLTIDSANETFDEILDNTARALNDYRVTEVAGVLARDVGMLCTSPNVKKGAKYKPIRSSKIEKLNDADRKAVNWGFCAKELSGIRTGFIDGTGANGDKVSSYEVEKWEYERPRGFDTHNEYFRILDFDGYFHLAANPMFLGSGEVEAYPGGGIDVICANTNGESKLQWGNPTYIEIMLSEMNFKYNFPNVSDNVMDGKWRMAFAAVIPQDDGGYRFLTISSEKPIETYSGISQEDVLPHKIMLKGVALEQLKKYMRRFELESVRCIPFLACDLKYSETRGWYWAATINEKAITFPDGETFNLVLKGFPTKIEISPIEAKLTIDRTQPQVQMDNGMPILVIPRSVAANAQNVEWTLRFRVTTCFGVNTQLQAVSVGAYTPTSLFGKGTSGVDAFNVNNEEWNDVDVDYTITFTDTNFAEVLKFAASQPSMDGVPGTLNVGIQFYNSELAKQMNFRDLITYQKIVFS